MCRNIKTLHNFQPPATQDEIRASALQFVRKLSGFARPSIANQHVFDRGGGPGDGGRARACWLRSSRRHRPATARSKPPRRAPDRRSASPRQGLRGESRASDRLAPLQQGPGHAVVALCSGLGATGARGRRRSAPVRKRRVAGRGRGPRGVLPARGRGRRTRQVQPAGRWRTRRSSDPAVRWGCPAPARGPPACRSSSPP